MSSFASATNEFISSRIRICSLVRCAAVSARICSSSLRCTRERADAVFSSFFKCRKRTRLTWTWVMIAMATESERVSSRVPCASTLALVAGMENARSRFQLALAPHESQLASVRKSFES